MAAVAGAVLLLALGLARPLGRPAALLAAAALGGANLMLEHGRLALVEATVVVLLTGAFVLATRAAWRPSAAAGAGVGLLVAAAVSVKANALLPGLVLLGVVLVAAARRRDRPALAMGLTGLATLVLAGAAWLVAVALPNWERFRTALRIWPTVEYLGTPVAIAGRVGRYLADSDQALGRSLPLLLAAALGLAALARRWPRLEPAARDALVMAGLWGAGLWLAVAVGDYLPGHYTAPNRYVVPALPGLAVLAGFGLADLAALAGRAVGGAGERDPGNRGRAGRVAGMAAVVLGVAVALPGVLQYLDGARASGRLREQGQRALATSLPSGRGGVRGLRPDAAVRHPADHPDAVADRRRQRPRPGGAVRGDPRAGRHRAGRPDGEGGRPHRRPARPRLARIPWGNGELFLYGPPSTSGRGVAGCLAD